MRKWSFAPYSHEPHLFKLGWHMNLDFCSILIYLKNSREDGGLFLWTIHMKNLQAKGLGPQKWCILVIISLGIIIMNSTLCFFLCSSQSKSQGRAVAVWWWWAVELTGGNRSSCSWETIRNRTKKSKFLRNENTIFTVLPILRHFWVCWWNAWDLISDTWTSASIRLLLYLQHFLLLRNCLSYTLAKNPPKSHPSSPLSLPALIVSPTGLTKTGWN